MDRAGAAASERAAAGDGRGGSEICGWRVGVGDFISPRARGDRLVCCLCLVVWWMESSSDCEHEAGSGGGDGGGGERRRGRGVTAVRHTVPVVTLGSRAGAWVAWLPGARCVADTVARREQGPLVGVSNSGFVVAPHLPPS